MRKAGLFLVAMVLCASWAAAQGEVIIQSTQFTWDDTNAPGLTEESKIYCQEDAPGVVIGAATLRATIAMPELVWTNDLSLGHWFCVVTAARPSSGWETGPSNELETTVVSFTAPDNFRKEVPVP